MKCLLRFIIENGSELIIPAFEYIDEYEIIYIHLFNGYIINNSYISDRIGNKKIISKTIDYSINEVKEKKKLID